MQEEKKAAVYCSYAVKNDKNINNQKKMCQAFADKKGIPIAKYFIDSGSFGRIEKKRALCNLLNYVSKNKVDYLIVYDWKYLSRNSKDLNKLKSIFKRNVVKLVSVQQAIYEFNFPLSRLFKKCFCLEFTLPLRQGGELPPIS